VFTAVNLYSLHSRLNTKLSMSQTAQNLMFL